MASLKAMKPVGTKPIEPFKKEPAAKPSGSAPKTPASKPAPKKVEQKPREPKKKRPAYRDINILSPHQSVKHYRLMASLKAEKSAGTDQPSGQAKKEPAKLSDSTSKTTASKPASKKAAQKPQEAKKKLVIDEEYRNPLSLYSL
ncbi:hypothetical protein Peur_005757 [Populus x canadensis]